MKKPVEVAMTPYEQAQNELRLKLPKGTKVRYSDSEGRTCVGVVRSWYPGFTEALERDPGNDAVGITVVEGSAPWLGGMREIAPPVASLTHVWELE